MAVSKSPAQVTTGKVRFSYTHLFKPKSQNGGKEKYRTTVLIPKTDLETKKRIDVAIQYAIQEGAQKRFGGQIPDMNYLAIPIHDGDGLMSNGNPYSAECKGCWVINASSDMAPEVVDVARNPIIDQSQVYSGMYGRVSLRFFAYNANGKKGIGCGLGNVLKLEDGEPLNGRTTADDDFDDGYVPPTQPSTYQPNSYF